MAEPQVTGGQSPANSPTGTIAAEPVTHKGPSASNGQTTPVNGGPGANASAEPTFFDPTLIADKPELMTAYKQMQGQFTKQTQRVKESQHKIDAYDQIQRDPAAAAKQFLAQQGYQVILNDGKAPKDFSPNSWEDVFAKAKEMVMADLQPLLSQSQKEVVELKQRSSETYLDANHPDWRIYEADMVKTLNEHPTLAKDLDKLYDISLPANIREARAMQKAQEKLNGITQHAQVSGPNATSRPQTQEPKGPLSFDQAVQVARSRLATQGIQRPSQ